MEFARFLRLSLFCPILQFAPKPALAHPYHFGLPISSTKAPLPIGRPNRLQNFLFPQRQGDTKPKYSQNRQTTPKSALTRLFPQAKSNASLGWPTHCFPKLLFSRQWQGDPKPKIPKTDKLRRNHLWLAPIPQRIPLFRAWMSGFC